LVFKFEDNDVITPVLPTYARIPLSFDRGEGAYLYTGDGEAYLDFGSGIAVNSLGHAHPHLVEVLGEQAAKLWHTSNLFNIPGQERLVQRLVDASFADTVFFTNSGGEAMECSIKMARKYHAHGGQPERFRIITFEGAFHGRTLAMLAAGGQQKYLDGFGPKVDGFDQVPFGDLDAVKAAIGDETAGILIEPIMGEGGIKLVEPQFLRALRNLCDEHGILLVLDEIQCGLGRTGKLYAHEWANITPDILASAKGIGGGFPMGACLATQEAARGMTAGSHGSTFGGNPLAMAVGNGVLDIVLEPGFLQQVQKNALLLKQNLARVCDEFPDVIEEIRGEGLMMGIKCKVANTELAAACLEQKLLVVGAGENVVRILPPLISDAEVLNEGVARIERACHKIREANASTTAAQ